MDILSDKKLLPAVTLTDTDLALFVAEALLEGGLDIMEVTFRTPVAASAISNIVKEFPKIVIGAGTILSPGQVTAAKNAGAQFGLAPGYNERVVRVAERAQFPFIPGIMTPSDIEQALAKDLKVLKLFPINFLGGGEYIKSLQGPYQHTDIKFIPMGGVNPWNMKKYLNLESVVAVGGSWLVPNELVANRQFHKITNIVHQSLNLANK